MEPICTCTSIDNLKVSVKGIYSARLTRISKAGIYWDNTFQEIHYNLKKMKKAHSSTSLSNVHKEPKSYGDKTQMFLRSRSVPCVLSHVIVDAVADSIPRILLVPNVVLIWNFLATNDKGYNNSRLSDNIHRGSRQIHDKWLRFTCPSCT